MSTSEKYTQAELAAMSGEAFQVAQNRGFLRPAPAEAGDEPTFTGQPMDTGENRKSKDPYAPTAWAQSEYDFVTPSGQRCLLRPLDQQALLQAGILDKATRLPGIVADEVIAKAEGQPPKLNKIPNAEQLGDLFGIVDIIVTMAVVKPEILPVPTDGGQRVQGAVYVDSIRLSDRMAIMEEALGEVKKLDSFRPGAS